MQRIILYVTLVLLTCIASVTIVFHFYQQSIAQAIQQGNCVDIPATPDYLSTNSATDGIAAINHARIFEHLPPLRLAHNFYQLTAVQQQFVLVNLERTDRGLFPLKMDANLTHIAQTYSEQLSNLHFFSHTSPISGTFDERVNSNPLFAAHYSLAAENLAGNPVAGVGPIYEYMYDDAAESCGHRLNILNPDLKLIGIGMISDRYYGSISAQEFLAPSAWQPYRGTTRNYTTPHISVQAQENEQHTAVDYRSAVTQETGTVRVTWFVDHIDKPAHVGYSFTLDLTRLAPGKHTIYAYAVDSGQDYARAQYSISV